MLAEITARLVSKAEGSRNSWQTAAAETLLLLPSEAQASTHVAVPDEHENCMEAGGPPPEAEAGGATFEAATDVIYAASEAHVALVGRGGPLGTSVDPRTQNETHVLQPPATVHGRRKGRVRETGRGIGSFGARQSKMTD